ncbi:MAG: winged helix-turn-helix transcriptional regulator [Ruminococcaceae bacterium]|nr:winged helix-turn-helix transcriptional regulator [Oscillospiraceae bacterium]
MISNISVAVRLVNIHFDKWANELLEPVGLSHAQFKVLNLLLARDPFSLRQVDIEDFFQISNPTVTGILRSLEEKGMIEKRANPSDGRSKVIGATEKAEAMREDLHRTERALSDRIRRALSAEECEEFLALLNKIIDSELTEEEQFG